MLNGLCSAGTRLALSLQTLLSVHETMAQCRVTAQCLAGWEELTRATNVASHTVKKHVVAAMKDYEIVDNDGEKHVSLTYPHWYKLSNYIDYIQFGS